MFIEQLSVCDVPQLFLEFGKCCADQTGARHALRCAASRIVVRTWAVVGKNDWQFSNPRIDTASNNWESACLNAF